MKKRFKQKASHGRLFILKAAVGLFGPQLDVVAAFDDRDGNRERVKSIVKQLNECDRHTEHPKQYD